jgi:hypothetical protein
VAILKHVGTTDWDRKRLNTSVNGTLLTCSEDAARAHAPRTQLGTIWAGSLSRVNTLKCLTHVSHRKAEPTVLDSGPRRWYCIILKASKGGVQPVRKQDNGVRGVANFPFIIRDGL